MFPRRSAWTASALSSALLLAIATTACSPGSVTLEPPTSTAPNPTQSTKQTTAVPNRVSRNLQSPDTAVDRAAPSQSSNPSDSQPSQQSSSSSDNQSHRQADEPEKTSDRPDRASLTNTVNGDLMCYATLVDASGKTHRLGATFEACQQPNSSFNRPVNLTYDQVQVNDCPSAEPCGKTREETLITKMEPVASADSRNPAASETWSNGAWKIEVGNLASWSGQNGTGNLSYNGCDDKGQCLDLVGGRMSSRNGMMQMAWTNGNYAYVLEYPMGDPERSTEASEGTLTVLENDKVILKATGLQKIQ